MPSLTKGYLDFYFSFSLEQLISIPTRVTSKTATLIDHVLTNSSQKVSQCDVIEKKNDLETDKDHFRSAKMALQKAISKKTKSYFQEKNEKLS